MPTYELQAVTFPTDFGEANAKRWLEMYNVKPMKLHKTAETLRYRVADPELFGSYVTRRIDHGIHLIMGYRKMRDATEFINVDLDNIGNTNLTDLPYAPVEDGYRAGVGDPGPGMPEKMLYADELDGSRLLNNVERDAISFARIVKNEPLEG